MTYPVLHERVPGLLGELWCQKMYLFAHIKNVFRYCNNQLQDLNLYCCRCNYYCSKCVISNLVMLVVLMNGYSAHIQAVALFYPAKQYRGFTKPVPILFIFILQVLNCIAHFTQYVSIEQAGSGRLDSPVKD